MLNLSTLFHTSTEDKDAFLDNLTLTEQEKTQLEAARVDIRNCLRDGVPAVLQAQGFDGEVPRPRFFTQGSWSYKTLNAPAKEPQQADLDDGSYLPMTFVKQTKRPSTASQIFFAAAEEALRPLVAKNKWGMDTSKDTCIRVEISKKAHIDIPLYAIPDEEFMLLKAAMEHRGYDGTYDSAIKAEQDVWTALPPDSVLLAHRKENWKKSDPRPLRDWFVGEVEAKGTQLRRVVRYLKAFRDWRWPEGGPSSILLMAAAVPMFDAQHGRDDLALLNVVSGMAAALRAGVDNPTDANESLTERLGPEKVEEAALAFEAFEKYLRGALDCSSPEQACAWMIEKFGSRFPNEPSWVKISSVKDTVASVAPVPAASEIVGRNKSA
jgi:hypothetical protein